MASDQESCFLCKEYLRDPVSIPCGHIFCSICLKTYWDHADYTGSYTCPQCRVSYNKRPTPRRIGGSRQSTLQRNSESFPPPPPSPDYNYAGPQDVGCDICIGKKHKAIKTCLMCLASYCEKHLKPHFESATFKRHKLVDEIGHLDRQICPQHQKGLELFCRTDQMCICVLCTVKEHKGHDMVSAEQERAEEQQRLGATQAEIQEKIHDRLKQMEELKQAVDSLKNSAQRALQECEKMFADMMRSIERMQQEMAKLISSNKRAALSNAEGHLERLTHEIADLKRRDNEITQLSRTEDHIHFIQTYHMLIAQTEAEELPTVSVNPYFSFGPVNKAVSEMKQHLNEFSNDELVKVAKAVNKMTFCQLDESKKRRSVKSEEAAVYKSVPVKEPQHRDDFMRYACQLTLDPNTAYRQLYLSRGNRKAALKRDPQSYGDHPARFDSLPQVLCMESLSGGAYYWEVDWSGEGAADQSAVSNSRGTTAGEQESKQRRKSYLTPVRDEEAEAQRKARSRHARQSRRSTQGVTLTDLQEAEKTMKTDNKGREKKEEEEKEKEKEKEAKAKKGEEGEVSWRSRIASLQKSDLLGLTQPTSAPRSQTSDKKDVEASTGESETERWARERRERRQARARRKAQRTGESDDNDPSGEEEFSGSGLDPQTVRHLSSRSDNSCNDFTQGGGSEMKDFKKLFEEVSRENSQLQSQLQDTQRIVSQTRLDLEKATQRQERFTDCSALLELERKDRRMLERRMAELEEELKVLVDLRADNQRLKDENGALIRVISKLSK